MYRTKSILKQMAYINLFRVYYGDPHKLYIEI
jgi:hypothetical protein